MRRHQRQRPQPDLSFDFEHDLAALGLGWIGVLENLVNFLFVLALRREVLEMQQAGFTTREIHQRENEIRQNAVSTTRQALKEHFVLDRIAETENIEVEENELQIEIIQMAIQSGENPRRVRSRLQKRGMMENLEAQLRERKAVDFILERATFEDEPLDMEIASTTESVSAAVCGVSVESMTATDDSDDDAEAGDSGEE